MILERYDLRNKSDMDQWDEFVKAHPKGTAFHRSSWLRVIHETYSFEPLLFVWRDRGADISGIAPFFITKSPFMGTRLVSIPFSDYGGPLCADSNQINDFMSEIMAKHRRKTTYLEVRCALPDSAGMFAQGYYKRHILRLSCDPKVNMKRIDKRTIQYSIRKAQREGVTISEENNPSGLAEFCRLNKLTRKKRGLPYQPQLFFDKLFEHLISKNDAFILLAACEGIVIAAGLFLRFNDFVYYKYNASDPAYLTKKTPNHLLTWHAIEGSCLGGSRYFDFGRTSATDEGLLRYKEMWGGEASDLPYYFYPEVKTMKTQEGQSFLYRTATKMWHSLPEAMIDFIGPRIYRYLA